MSPEQKNAELCWGQRYLWLRHHQLPVEHRNDAHILCRFDLPEGVSIPGIRLMLNYLVRRHEGLRTTYHLGQAGPQQQVHPPAGLTLVTVTSERDGAESPSEAVERLNLAEFELAAEWPIRACVVTTGGLPRQLVLVLNHIAFDAWTVEMFERELRVVGAAIAHGRPAVLEPVRHQPLDLARHESSPAAIAVKDRAMARWRAEIAQLPADTFRARRRPTAAPTACSATLTSPDLLAATRQLAARHQVWPSVVHLAAYTMVLAAYTGSQQVSFLSFNGNRDLADYADVMTCTFSPLLISLDCRDDPAFVDVLRRAEQRLQLSHSDDQAPYDELVELLSAESFHRGEALRIGAELNFLSHASHSSGARRTRYTWNAAPAAWAASGADSYFRIYELRDAVVLGLNAVSTVLDADAVERFLRGYEKVLLACASAATELRLSDVAPLVGFDALPAAGSPIRPVPAPELDAVETALLCHPAVTTVALAREVSGRVVAEVSTDRPVSAAQLRTHLLGRLYDHAGLRCPDWFQISWRPCEGPCGTVCGDGRTGEPVTAVSAGEQALASAVRQVNGLGELDLSHSYPVAGGRVLRLPRVLAELRRDGWDGVSLQQLAGARPLQALASELTRTS
ncbi:MAG: condensation domain-containing protein [Jatrophihabitantaceae bacterium]